MGVEMRKRNPQATIRLGPGVEVDWWGKDILRIDITQRNLKCISLSERRQSEKAIHCMIPII